MYKKHNLFCNLIISYYYVLVNSFLIYSVYHHDC
nr:MAG TPA: hypothetical protein [Caudoviricetes sp.]